MKKKLLLFSLFLLLIFPFNVKAATYKGACRTIADLKRNSVIKTWPSTAFKVSQNASHSGGTNSSSFCFHSIEDGGYTFVSICAGIGKRAETNISGMVKNTNLSTLKNVSNQAIGTTQAKVLEDLLSFGYHYCPSGTCAVSSLKTDNASAQMMMAMQILVWEIVEGGRTSFSQIAPNVYNENDSAYKKVIYPNGGDNPNQSGTLFYAYKKIINDVNSALNPSASAAFGKTYKLTYSNGKYTRTVTGIGKYTTCKSNKTNVTVSVSGTSVTVSVDPSKIGNANATITCSYKEGSGFRGQTDPFAYYNFPTGYVNFQSVLRGAAIKEFSKSFNVEVESTKLKIVKVNEAGAALNNVKFTISNADGTKNLTGNGAAVTLDKSGTYNIAEATAPAGYEQIPGFEIKIDGSTKKITSCTAEGTAGGNKTCLNGLVKITYDTDGTIVLTITNIANNIKIQKLNSNDEEIEGATFEIRDLSNNPLKFNANKYTFTYSTSGNKTNLNYYVDDNETHGTYIIKAIPDGKYKIVETGVRDSYKLTASEEERTTYIELKNGILTTCDKKYTASTCKPVENAMIKITNYISFVKIKKLGDGKPLSGVKFILLKEDKETRVKLLHVAGALYEYKENASDPVNYMETDVNGIIRINHLPDGTYYLKETASVEPYLPPEGEAAYRKLVVKMTKNGPTVNSHNPEIFETIYNNHGSVGFNFYKIDENGKYLTGAKFRIQKYDNSTGLYSDMRVKAVQNDGTYDEHADIFEPNDDGKVIFTLQNGIATFINMSASTKYRIIETSAPKGYKKVGKDEAAIISIDRYGYVSGTSSILNQKQEVNAGDTQAELIVNISTGVDRVRYALIIGGIIIFLGLLFVLNKKTK